MRIKVDWQIVDEDTPWPEQPAPTNEPPRRQAPRNLIVAVALVPVLGVAIFAAYIAWTYHQQLNQATVPVQEVARAELQAVADNDQVAFMALQDPADQIWRTLQERNFGRLERVGLPEYGWQSTGAPPQIGPVSLEPGGALLQVTYQFSVTQPLPGEPATVTLQIPAFYMATASGWVHAMPTAELWGAERTQKGKHVLVLYHQLDAAIVEPMIPHLDGLYEQLCAPLSCPEQVTVTFSNAVNTRRGFLAGNGVGNPNRFGQDFLGGSGPGNSPRSSQDFQGGNGLGNSVRPGRGNAGDGSAAVRLASPYVVALPTDAASRDQVYRVFEVQLARTLVNQTLGRNLYVNRQASQAIVQWELARVGLAGPFITQANQSTLAAKLESGVEPPLATIPLRPTFSTADSSNQVIASFAFVFLEQTVGGGTVERLIPALGTSATLGEAIRTTLGVDPQTFEQAWQSYLKNAAKSGD